MLEAATLPARTKKPILNRCQIARVLKTFTTAHIPPTIRRIAFFCNKSATPCTLAIKLVKHNTAKLICSII